MKHLTLLAILTAITVSTTFAQSGAPSPDSFWLDIYRTADSPEDRLYIVEQIIEEKDAGGPAVQPETWDVLLGDLLGRWNNLPDGNDRFQIERALRLVLAEIRQHGESDRARQLLLLARQAKAPHLKGEAILTLGAIRYVESSEFIAEELQRVIRAPQTDPLADEVIAHACIISLAQFRTEYSISALSAAGADTVWLPGYLRRMAKQALQSLLSRNG